MTVHKDLDPIGQCQWGNGQVGPKRLDLTGDIWVRVVPVSVARQLETERDEAREELETLKDEIQALLDAVAGQPVSQGMVRDGEVIARLHNLDSHHNPHWSDEENRAYSLGVRNAIHVIEHPEEANQSAEAGQPRSVLAREGGER